MPSAPIVFAPIQQTGLSSVGGAPGPAINVVVDARGTVRRRPSVAAYSEAPSTVIDANGINGIYQTQSGALFAVGATAPGRQIYRLSGGSAGAITGGVNAELKGSSRPTFAETEALLVVAGGDSILKIELASFAGTPLGGDPPSASHVIATASRLLANDLVVSTSAVRFSDVATSSTDFSGHEEWALAGIGLSGYFFAQARPDRVQAIAEGTNEVFVFGATNLEIWGPDANPDTGFSRIATREYGCVAPYSIVRYDDRFAWIDHRRRIVVSDGRGHQVLSNEIQADLDGMDTVADAFGYRVQFDVVDCLVWTFPTDGRTYVYQKGAAWGQWSGWDASTSSWAPFSVTSHFRRTDTGVSVVGTSAGRVGRLVMGSGLDLSDPVVARVETGRINHDTSRRKWCRAVHVRMSRGTSTGTEPIASLAYSDVPGEWSPPIRVEMGMANDTMTVVSLRGLGTYRDRAWRFEFSGEEDLALAEVIEEYEVLEV